MNADLQHISVDAQREVNELIVIAECASRLEEWLGYNAGPTADWPVQLNVDNVLDAKALSDHLQMLKAALVPYRANRVTTLL